jgi:GAF domain-containing protein
VTLTSGRADDRTAHLSGRCNPADQRAAAVLEEVLRTGSKVVPGIRHVAVSVVGQRQQCEVLASTGELPRRFESLQSALAEGPTLDAVRGIDPIVVGERDVVERWPQFGSRASQCGLRSIVSVRLSWADRVLGALTVYSDDAEPVPEAGLEFVQAFAAQCSATLAFARKADQMEVAMLTRQQIGQAVGVLMERFGLSPEAAFNYLRRVSQTRNVKLRDVARSLVRTGELPLVAAEGDAGAR